MNTSVAVLHIETSGLVHRAGTAWRHWLYRITTTGKLSSSKRTPYNETKLDRDHLSGGELTAVSCRPWVSLAFRVPSHPLLALPPTHWWFLPFELAIWWPFLPILHYCWSLLSTILSYASCVVTLSLHYNILCFLLGDPFPPSVLLGDPSPLSSIPGDPSPYYFCFVIPLLYPPCLGTPYVFGDPSHTPRDGRFHRLVTRLPLSSLFSDPSTIFSQYGEHLPSFSLLMTILFSPVI